MLGSMFSTNAANSPPPPSGSSYKNKNGQAWLGPTKSTLFPSKAKRATHAHWQSDCRAVKVDETTMAASRGRYARVCVEVDLTKPLVSMITLLGFAQAVEYEGLHQICFDCGKYGQKKISAQKKEKACCGTSMRPSFLGKRVDKASLQSEKKVQL
ncbi:UNVERIFIED_CONTAM: hypothetical protein Scaly_2911500 [Sesamum calycinum]|uniref:FLZ-type domain-containing protein n=1 Tax=Sesamum calycinum TaxID=2727403 RepID=A0AAW2L4Q5_9LAMI